ncbi:MAG: hypothetical protein ACLU4N_03920 [Butyricimonas faecihominis]
MNLRERKNDEKLLFEDLPAEVFQARNLRGNGQVTDAFGQTNRLFGAMMSLNYRMIIFI